MGFGPGRNSRGDRFRSNVGGPLPAGPVVDTLGQARVTFGAGLRRVD